MCRYVASVVKKKSTYLKPTMNFFNKIQLSGFSFLLSQSAVLRFSLLNFAL